MHLHCICGLDDDLPFMFLSPSECNDAHLCGQGALQGDQMAQVVDALLAAPTNLDAPLAAADPSPPSFSPPPPASFGSP